MLAPARLSSNVVLKISVPDPGCCFGFGLGIFFKGRFRIWIRALTPSRTGPPVFIPEEIVATIDLIDDCYDGYEECWNACCEERNVCCGTEEDPKCCPYEEVSFFKTWILNFKDLEKVNESLWRYFSVVFGH